MSMEERKREGKRLAEANRGKIEAMVASGRYANSTSNRNMIKALKLHPWHNTVGDWQRLFEAEMIARLSHRRKTRRNPENGRVSFKVQAMQDGRWRWGYIDAKGVVHEGGKPTKTYAAAVRAAKAYVRKLHPGLKI